MFYSTIDAASLNDPTILNRFYHRKVTVQYEPESPTSKYHYIFLIQIEDKEIESAMTTLQKEMKESWYSFFWSKGMLYIVFDAQRFQIDLPDGWDSGNYKSAQDFGRSQGIPEVYLDFKTHFQPYKEMVAKL